MLTPNEVLTPLRYPPFKSGQHQFRLLKLLPAQSDRISGTLEVFNIGAVNCPRYQALSYQWGPEVSLQKITVNNGYLEIRPNLFDFLAQVESDSNIEYIWIDQICIDQSSVQERNAQVPLMDQIYTFAFRVIAWLGGPSSDGSRMLEETLRFYKQKVASNDLSPIDPSERSPHDPWRFIKATYWGRGWIQQELLLAKNITLRCGSESMEWADLTKILEGPKGPIEQWPYASFSLFRLRRGNTPLQLLPLPHVLDAFSRCQWTDGRDRVFGLLALVRPGERIEVDYGLDPYEVMKAAVLKCVELGFDYGGCIGENGSYTYTIPYNVPEPPGKLLCDLKLERPIPVAELRRARWSGIRRRWLGI
ncbi:MAG: hypothetical protein M1820_003933 [Bogoriella megaspora]|nr:MAG: hypothetical protein M1820_003933 [Bogoriella megaspora]